jgi:hypothetical protein
MHILQVLSLAELITDQFRIKSSGTYQWNLSKLTIRFWSIALKDF